MSDLKKAAVTVILGVLLAGGMAGSSVAAGVPDREADPVVLTGTQTPALIGIEPGDLVAFRWDGAWQQVPVQVDERKVASYRVIRNESTAKRDFLGEVYADSQTWAGADGQPQLYSDGARAGQPIPGTRGDPGLDLDDEIVLMANDSGSRTASESGPPGVDLSSRTPVGIEDPLDPGVRRYLYLFRATADLDPSAGTNHVTYELAFDPPLVPDYLHGYDFGGIDDQPLMPPANPEVSSVETAVYEQTFPGKWMVDGLRIKAGGATGVDILDGDKSTVGTDIGCGRNELTFSRGDGGLIANIDGPVRAVRSYIGANSGTFTQRDQIYYRSRVDTNTYLRVHDRIDYLWMAMDYSEAAHGMTYRNSLNPEGVTIDGAHDEVTPGQLAWEQATGEQGSLTNVSRVNSDIPGLKLTSNYLDREVPPTGSSMLCSGDDKHAYGASGPLTIGTGPFSTDPTDPSADVKKFEATRTAFFGPPGEAASTARLRSQQIDSPLVITTGTASEPGGPPTPPTPPDAGPDPTKPARQNWAGLKVTVKPARMKSRIGVAKIVRVKVRNVGDMTAKRVKICPVGKKSLIKTGACKSVKRLKEDRSVTRKFRFRLRHAAAPRRQVKLRFRAKASGSKARSGSTLIRPVGR